MINYILILTFINLFSCFIIPPRITKSTKLFNNINKNNTDIKIINLDFKKFITEYDALQINKLNGKIPLPPQTEEEIEDDSFEGYLKRNFLLIKNNNNAINFDTFYKWRTTIGTLLTEEEISYIYNKITNDNEYCNLMNFITINKIIDENDGADF